MKNRILFVVLTLAVSLVACGDVPKKGDGDGTQNNENNVNNTNNGENNTNNRLNNVDPPLNNVDPPLNNETNNRVNNLNNNVVNNANNSATNNANNVANNVDPGLNNEVGEESCAAVLECTSICETETCLQDCLETGTPDAQQGAVEFLACVRQSCADATSDDELRSCAQEFCPEEIRACFNE